MNKLDQHVNIIVVSASIVGLSCYLYQPLQKYPYNYFIVFFISFTHFTIFKSIHLLHCVSALLTSISVFINQESWSTILCSVSLSIQISIGYILVNNCRDNIYRRFYQGFLHLSLSLGLILSSIMKQIQIDIITIKLGLLACCLTNFYLPHYQNKTYKYHYREYINTKSSYILIPLYISNIYYSIGYLLGVYVATFSFFHINRYIKSLIISFLLLIEVLTYQKVVIIISQVFRGILIYQFENKLTTIQIIFILGYLLFINFIQYSSILIYLLFGYLIIAANLWRQDYSQNNYERYSRKTQIQLSLINNRQIQQ